MSRYIAVTPDGGGNWSNRPSPTVRPIKMRQRIRWHARHTADRLVRRVGAAGPFRVDEPAQWQPSWLSRPLPRSSGWSRHRGLMTLN